MLCRSTAHLFLLLALTSVATAQSDSLERYVGEEMVKQHIPGLSLAVVKEVQGH